MEVIYDKNMNKLNINDTVMHDNKPCRILKIQVYGRVQILKNGKKSTVNSQKLTKIIDCCDETQDEVQDEEILNPVPIDDFNKMDDTDSETGDYIRVKRKKRKYNSKEQSKKNYSFHGDNQCILSNQGPIEMAHIVPLDEKNDEPINILPLRGDLHASFDMYKWGINPEGEELSREDSDKWPFSNFGDFKKHKIIISHKTPKWFSIMEYKDDYIPILVGSQKYINLAYESFKNENNAK